MPGETCVWQSTHWRDAAGVAAAEARRSPVSCARRETSSHCTATSESRNSSPSPPMTQRF